MLVEGRGLHIIALINGTLTMHRNGRKYKYWGQVFLLKVENIRAEFQMAYKHFAIALISTHVRQEDLNGLKWLLKYTINIMTGAMNN